MSLLFGASRRDQVHLLSALQSLQPTSLAGLSAALSWSERKTERVLREVAASHEAPILFDPVRRMVTIRSAKSSHSTTVSGGVAAAAATDPPAVKLASAPPLVLPKSFPSSARCPACGEALLPTATGDASVCPSCGELSTRRGRAAAPVASPATPESAPGPVPVESGRTVVHSADRRSQELFAAWVTSRPIPCPRCRTALKHRGVGEYGCPSCGHRVTFETSVGGIGSQAAAAPPS